MNFQYFIYLNLLALTVSTISKHMPSWSKGIWVDKLRKEMQKVMYFPFQRSALKTMGVVHKAEVISFPKWYNPEMEAKHWRSKWLKHLDLSIKWNLRDFVSLKHGIHDSWGQLLSLSTQLVPGYRGISKCWIYPLLDPPPGWQYSFSLGNPDK